MYQGDLKWGIRDVRNRSLIKAGKLSGSDRNTWIVNCIRKSCPFFIKTGLDY